MQGIDKLSVHNDTSSCIYQIPCQVNIFLFLLQRVCVPDAYLSVIRDSFRICSLKYENWKTPVALAGEKYCLTPWSFIFRQVTNCRTRNIDIHKILRNTIKYTQYSTRTHVYKTLRNLINLNYLPHQFE
jgi:hypothetical protein